VEPGQDRDEVVGHGFYPTSRWGAPGPAPHAREVRFATGSGRGGRRTPLGT
jgi:hypothetical protein